MKKNNFLDFNKLSYLLLALIFLVGNQDVFANDKFLNYHTKSDGSEITPLIGDSEAQISPSGRYIVFSTRSQIDSVLDTDALYDVYIKDMSTNLVKLVSEDIPSNASAVLPTISDIIKIDNNSTNDFVRVAFKTYDSANNGCGSNAPFTFGIFGTDYWITGNINLVPV